MTIEEKNSTTRIRPEALPGETEQIAALAFPPKTAVLRVIRSNRLRP